MASACYAEDLTCPVCLAIFTDPVTFTCGHSFCRTCITGKSFKQCPQCRAGLPSADEVERLPTSHILRSLAEKAKEEQAGQQRQGPGPAQAAQWLCPEHDEKLKVFCVTDQQLACIICRDGEKHEGHKFKPIREAAASLRRNLNLGLVNLVGQTDAIQSLTKAQDKAMTKAKDLAGQLKTQIHRQFESMHQFLRKREDEIINELKIKEEDAVQNMTKSLKEMKLTLSECRELRESWTELVKVTGPEQILKRWTEEHSSETMEDLFKPRSDNLFVVQSPLFQGPFQSHLQFFMWKEMLQVVEPRAELLTLRNDNSFLTVSDDRRSLLCAPENLQSLNIRHQFGRKHQQTYSSGIGAPAFSFGSTRSAGMAFTGPFPQNVVVPQTYSLYSTNEFSAGQHYWEVEVGHRDYWCLGIKDYFLKYEIEMYSACEPEKNTELSVTSRFRKVGVYLDCSSKGLSFYDADTMVRVHSVYCCGMSLPVSAYFSIQKKDSDPNPMTVCWY